MSTRPTRSLAALVAVAVAVVLIAGCSSTDSSSAAGDPASRCRVAELTLGPAVTSGDSSTTSAAGAATTPTAPAGGMLTASGRWFAKGCLGLHATTGTPLTGIRILVIQGSNRISVARVDADGSLGFNVTFGVPGTLRSGPARVVAQRSTAADSPTLAAAAFVVG